jgi:hypothetical protein
MTTNIEFQDFIPNLALLGLNPSNCASEHAYCSETDALVLFVDMSGFSQMASDFVTKSERGAEGLRELINAVFETVVASVNAHGGSLLYYAGDAVNAAWVVADGKLGVPCERAIACGLDIQKRCKDLPDFWQGLGIEMKANVRHGPLWSVDAPGTPDTRQVLFCGEVLEGLSDGAGNAAGAGVALNAPLFDALRAGVLGEIEASEKDGNVLVTALPAREFPVPDVMSAVVESSAYLQPFFA